jgi:hypothetical protein
MKESQDLARKMAETTNEDLLAMFTRPDDWTPEALEAARIELRKRNVECIVNPVPGPATERTGRFGRWWPVVRKRMVTRWRTWSAARKGMVIGAITGFSANILIGGLFVFLEKSTDQSREWLGWIMLAAAGWINSPFLLLVKITRWKIESLAAGICVAVVVNMLAYAIIGGAIGYAAHQVRKIIRRMGWV